MLKLHRLFIAEETALPQGLPRANGVANGVARAHNGVFHNGALANGFAAIANNKVKTTIN